MGTTADKLNKLLQTKQTIKQAIIDKGVDVADDTKFADYPSKITAIESGGSYYETLWNAITNNNTDYSYLFHNYKGLELDVSNLDTSKVTDMYNLFYYCNNVTKLDVSKWDTKNVKDMRYVFNNCTSITKLDVSEWDTGNATTMERMFYYCSGLTELDVSNFNTRNVTDIGDIFAYCNKLESLDVSNWDVSKVTDMGGAFQGCRSLTSLDCSSWDISKITGNYYLSKAFDSCDVLVDLYPPKNINAPMDVTYSTALSHDSLMRIINNLMTTTSTKKLTLGATNKAKLADEELAIATNKGWTIA